MATDINFIRRNPYGSSFADATRTLADQAAYAAEEQRRREQGQVDDALRSGILNIRARQAPADQQVGPQQMRPGSGTVPPITAIRATPPAVTPGSDVERGAPGAFGSTMLQQGQTPPNIETPVSPMSLAVGAGPDSGLEGGGSPGFGMPVTSRTAPLAAPDTTITAGLESGTAQPPSDEERERRRALLQQARGYADAAPWPPYRSPLLPPPAPGFGPGQMASARSLEAPRAVPGGQPGLMPSRAPAAPTAPRAAPQSVSPIPPLPPTPPPFGNPEPYPQQSLTLPPISSIRGQPAPQPIPIQPPPGVPGPPPPNAAVIPPEPTYAAPTGSSGVMSDATTGYAPWSQVAEALPVAGQPGTTGRSATQQPAPAITGVRAGQSWVAGDRAINNPGGIRGPGNTYRQYQSVADGQADMERLLRQYAASGRNTIETIIPRWAPAGDGPNNPPAYIARVEQLSGIPRNQPLDFNNPDTMRRITSAMATVEGVVPGGATAAPAPQQQAGVPRIQFPGFDWQSVAREVARVPGGGALAMHLMQMAEQGDVRNQTAGEALERLALTQAAHGDTQGAQYFAARAGLRLPPELLQSADFAHGALLAERLYRDEPDQAGRFAIEYGRSGGNMEQAFQAVGPPRSNPHYTLHQLYDADRTLLLRMDQQGNIETVADVRNPQYDLATIRALARSAIVNPNTQIALARQIAQEQNGGNQPSAQQVDEALNSVRSAGRGNVDTRRYVDRFLDPANPLSQNLPPELRSMRPGPEKLNAVTEWVHRTLFPDHPSLATPGTATQPAAATPTTPTAPPAATQARARQGTPDNPYRPTTPDEAAALPSGAWYIRADNGQPRQRP
jgi:hypothetical protein